MSQTVLLETVAFFQEGPGIRNWQYVESGGMPFVNIRCLINGRLDRSSMNQINLADAEGKYKHFQLEPGDIVVSSSGTLGRVAEVRKEDTPCLLNTSVIRFRPLDDRIDRRYLKYFLSSNNYLDQVTGLATGSAQQNYGPSHLKRVKIPLPNIESQKEIADILGTIDGKIELNRKMNETLEQMGQALFRHYFIDNPAAKNLAKVPLEELVSGKNGIVDGPFGTQMKVAEYRNIGIPVVEMPFLEGAPLYKDFNNYISSEKYEQVKRSTVLPGDIIMSKTGTLGLLGVFTDKWEKGILVSRLLKITVDTNKVPMEYIFFVLKKLSNDRYWDSISSGSTMPIINLGHLKKLPIIIPEEETLDLFSKIAKRILEMQRHNLEQSQTLTSLRDTLLPRLINGKIRV